MTATAVGAILALTWLAPWTRPLPRLPFLSPWAETATPPADGTAPAGPPPATLASTAPPTAPEAPPPSPAEPAVQAGMPTSPSPVAPSFDVVRVEPTGATIVAGRGEPGSVVTLLDGDRIVAEATVDASGQFALLPPDLGEGSHYLTLRSGTGAQAALVSKQGVAISVPKAGGASRPLVAMMAPDQPVRVLSDGSPIPLPGAPAPAAGAQPVAIQAVEAARGGKFSASGVAKAGSRARLYLNGAFLADVIAGKDGRWAVRVEKGMRPGQYVVRADELDGDSARVVHRAEVPFTYPATLGKGSGKQMLMAHAAPPALPGRAPGSPLSTPAPGDRTSVAGLSAGVPADKGADPAVASIVTDLKLTTVARGDSLWRISRKLLGRGIDYTEIYASNTGQIRDPALIYPGQIFVLPQRPAK